MQRHEFVRLAQIPGVNFQQLCQRAGISRKTGYKWKSRAEHGDVALEDRSRRPRHSPRRCPEGVAAEVIALRQLTPDWGGFKLRRRLINLGRPCIPAASTCTAILRRAGLLQAPKPSPGPWQRFERAQPNELWQMDFKGHFATQAPGRCHPLTILDDHSRYNILLEACADETGPTVHRALERAFREYGLPDALLCDNGPPWGASDPVCPYTSFTVALLRLGLRVLHGRPYHPQTQGKEERFHRTLRQELLRHHTWIDLAHCQRHFTAYRQSYNCERPHRALGGDLPLSRYRPSPRALPGRPPPIVYPDSDRVKQVRTDGTLYHHRHLWYVGRAFAKLPVGLRPSAQADGQWQVFFAQQLLGQIDLKAPRSVSARHSIYPSSAP